MINILAIDDESESLGLLTGILTAEGYQVRPADSGELALASIAVKPPDLILLDVRMSGMDGFEVCRRLKASEQTRDIPLMFISGAGDTEFLVEGLALGAVDFVSKPFRRMELLARVRTHLELARLRADLEEQVALRTAELRLANEQLQEKLVERRLAEQAQRESEERFRNLADTAPVGIWVTGPDDRTSFYNRSALTFTGRTMEQLISMSWAEFVHPDDLEGACASYLAALAERRAFRIECRLRRADGQYRWSLCTGVPRFINGAYAGYIGTTIDTTELKRSHERTMAAEKLESLGVLAAGIAHDFNNLLGNVLVESEIGLADIPMGSPARESIERIRMVAIRASEIVNLLTVYADGGQAELGAMDLSGLVEETLEMIRFSISKGAVLYSTLAKDLPAVRANPAQIRQVVWNLIMNAVEALDGRPGTVSVSTRLEKIGQGAARRPRNLIAGDYVRLEVSDTGRGMTEEVQARVFDPFYSTKFLGRGLGLAAVQGILRSHCGSINIESAPGKGSTFEVLLPCAHVDIRGSENRSVIPTEPMDDDAISNFTMPKYRVA